jgi:hypothetical protein
MVFEAKFVTVKGFVLAVAILLLANCSKIQAGCGDHVELGGIFVHKDHSTDSVPVNGRPCFGPQCSKKSQGLPGVPQGVTKNWVEKNGLCSATELPECFTVDLITDSRSAMFSNQGHPLGIFHPPRV